MGGMVRKELIDEILKLDPEDREYILSLVSARLSDDLPPQLSAKDHEELLRRVERFDSHPEAFIPWEELKAKLAAQRRGG
jgi:hypothetical protein